MMDFARTGAHLALFMGLGAAALTGWAGTARADATVTVDETSYSQPLGSVSATISYSGKTLASGSSSITTDAGAIQVHLAPGNALGVSYLTTYCVDLFHYTGANSYYDVNTAGSSPEFASVTSRTGATSWTSQQLDLLNALLYNGGNAVATAGANQATYTAALQIAIWEVEYAPILNAYSVGWGSKTFTNGALSVTSSAAVIAQVVNFLNDVVGPNPTWATNAAYSVGELAHNTLNSSSTQALVYLATNTNPGHDTPAPEPGTLVVMGAGLAALYAARRRIGLG